MQNKQWLCIFSFKVFIDVFIDIFYCFTCFIVLNCLASHELIVWNPTTLQPFWVKA